MGSGSGGLFSGTKGSGSAGSKFKNGELFEETITNGDTKIGGLAEVKIDGDTLTLDNLTIYSNKGNIPNQIGVKEFIKWINHVKGQAKEQGFSEMQIKGQRAEHSTSAKPGKVIDIKYDLKK